MSTGKNPYEIRLELLQMAQKHSDNIYVANMEFARKAFNAALAANKVVLDQWKDYMPQAYTLEEVMAKANELYGFVSKK